MNYMVTKINNYKVKYQPNSTTLLKKTLNKNKELK
jgi:hypothetical protein